VVTISGNFKSKPGGKTASGILLYMMQYFLLFMLFVSLHSNTFAQETEEKKKERKRHVSEKGDVKYGMASFYANKFEGRKTATGEIFSQNKFTCACNVAPLGTWVKVTNLSNNKSVVVKINDRLHPRMNRIVDLSKIAARRLDYVGKGLTRVKVEVIAKSQRKN
jgi:rare lipoprotein A